METSLEQAKIVQNHSKSIVLVNIITLFFTRSNSPVLYSVASVNGTAVGKYVGQLLKSGFAAQSRGCEA